MTQHLDAMQRRFSSISTMADLLQEQARRFWECQDKLLDSMESFANGWFDRRHAGTQAARDAAQRMCKAQTPADWIGVYQEWASGAFQRIMDDRSACQEQLSATASAFAGASALASKQETEPPQSEAKGPARSKAA